MELSICQNTRFWPPGRTLQMGWREEGNDARHLTKMRGKNSANQFRWGTENLFCPHYCVNTEFFAIRNGAYKPGGLKACRKNAAVKKTLWLSRVVVTMTVSRGLRCICICHLLLSLFWLSTSYGMQLCLSTGLWVIDYGFWQANQVVT